MVGCRWSTLLCSFLLDLRNLEVVVLLSSVFCNTDNKIRRYKTPLKGMSLSIDLVSLFSFGYIVVSLRFVVDLEPTTSK